MDLGIYSLGNMTEALVLVLKGNKVILVILGLLNMMRVEESISCIMKFYIMQENTLNALLVLPSRVLRFIFALLLFLLL